MKINTTLFQCLNIKSLNNNIIIIDIDLSFIFYSSHVSSTNEDFINFVLK